MERRSFRIGFRLLVISICVLAVAGVGGVVFAQAPVTPPPDQARAQALPPQQLDDLVAPIALYPDPLLGQVLVASTYPLEVVEAQQWLKANGGLQGQQLTDAARQQNWDASVQALVAMPDVLGRLTEDIRWTTDLGNAFLAQQADVMSAVQRMRERAQANGKLQSTPQETVTTENQGGQSAIQIQPADPQVIYVPQYDPAYVWGPPDWGYYPPLYYPSYGFWWGPGIDIGFYFGGWGGWGWGGWGWGWGPNWFGGGIFVNSAFYHRYGYHYGYGFTGGGFRGMTAWAHDPGHRLGVAYPNGQLSGRFGAASQASRVAAAQSGMRSGAAQSGMRPGAAQSGMRPGAAQPGTRPGAAQSGMRSGAAQSGTRPGAAQSGSWQRFSQGNAGTSNSFRDATPQAGARGSQSAQGPSSWQRFQGRQGSPATAQRYQGSAATAQRYQGSAAAAERYQAPAQRYQAPAQRYQAPAQRYQAPAQRYQAPAQSFRSAPRMSAPSFSGGGVSRGSSGGGGSRSFGGGGGARSGGGGHGGGRR